MSAERDAVGFSFLREPELPATAQTVPNLRDDKLTAVTGLGSGGAARVCLLRHLPTPTPRTGY